MSATMREIAADAVEQSKPVLERITTKAHDAIDKAACMPGQAKEWIGAKGEYLTARQKQLIDNTASYVSANPFKAIGIAVVAALLVGRLMK
jgi:ElaB/YqjD/DUF883 family membrane-anchored ribosome-binding protein